MAVEGPWRCCQAGNAGYMQKDVRIVQAAQRPFNMHTKATAGQAAAEAHPLDPLPGIPIYHIRGHNHQASPLLSVLVGLRNLSGLSLC